MNKYSKEDIAKLERYRDILLSIYHKYWSSNVDDAWKRRLCIHQEARIWRMIRREFPDIVILDGYYNV